MFICIFAIGYFRACTNGVQALQSSHPMSFTWKYARECVLQPMCSTGECACGHAFRPRVSQGSMHVGMLPSHMVHGEYARGYCGAWACTFGCMNHVPWELAISQPTMSSSLSSTRSSHICYSNLHTHRTATCTLTVPAPALIQGMLNYHLTWLDNSLWDTKQQLQSNHEHKEALL